MLGDFLDLHVCVCVCVDLCGSTHCTCIFILVMIMWFLNNLVQVHRTLLQSHFYNLSFA